MSVYYRSLIEQGKLLLDIYPNAAVAYSLRKLRSAYAGPAIQVRRNSDNTEQDFGFDSSGQLDTQPILDFVGYNLFSYSEELQQSVWVKTRTTVTTDTVVAPDGDSTGDIVFETTTSGTHGISRTLAVVNGADYSVSFYIKDEGRRYFQIRVAVNLSTDNTTQPTAMLDLTMETVISDNGFFRVSPTITSVGSGWYKIEYGLIANSTTSSTAFLVEYSTNGTQTAYIGDITKGMAIWGLQISQTSYNKPYSKTETSAEGLAFITTWYDQSGNGINATQATLTVQNRIVVNSDFIYVNNKIAAQFTADFYNLSAGVTPASQFITANVIDRPTGGRFATWGNRSNNQRPHLFSWNTDNNINCSPYSLGNFRTITNSSYGGQSIVTTKRIAGNVIQGSLNGIQYTPLSTQTSQSNVVILGGLNNVHASTGYLQETIWWNQNYSSLELNISDKINEYYGIY